MPSQGGVSSRHSQDPHPSPLPPFRVGPCSPGHYAVVRRGKEQTGSEGKEAPWTFTRRADPLVTQEVAEMGDAGDARPYHTDGGGDGCVQGV